MATVGKTITCRAAVVWKAGDPYTIENVDVAVPQKGEVRMRIVSMGICHSDMHIVEDGYQPDWYFPAVMGHEGAGIVESVGEDVTSVKQGDSVVLVFEGYCGECDYCKDSRTNLCRKQPRNNFQKDGTSGIFCKGQKLSQMCSISTFSEYTVTSEHNVVKVDSKANLNNLAPLGCAIPVGYGAVMNDAKVSPGATCAVWGLGGVGACVVMGCRDSGASKIIGIDTNQRKFEFAKQFGCTEFLNPKEVGDIPKKLAEMTNGGVDFCFVAVGDIPSMEQAFDSSHPAWGKTVNIGECPIGKRTRVGVWDLLYGKTLVGTMGGSYKMKLAVPTLLEKVSKGQIQLEKLISHRIPLEKINESYGMLKTGESLRTVINLDLKS